MDFHVSLQHLTPAQAEGQREHPGHEKVVITSSGVREELAGLGDGPRFDPAAAWLGHLHQRGGVLTDLL